MITTISNYGNRAYQGLLTQREEGSALRIGACYIPVIGLLFAAYQDAHITSKIVAAAEEHLPLTRPMNTIPENLPVWVQNRPTGNRPRQIELIKIKNQYKFSQIIQHTLSIALAIHDIALIILLKKYTALIPFLALFIIIFLRCIYSVNSEISNNKTIIQDLESKNYDPSQLSFEDIDRPLTSCWLLA